MSDEHKCARCKRTIRKDEPYYVTINSESVCTDCAFADASRAGLPDRREYER